MDYTEIEDRFSYHRMTSPAVAQSHERVRGRIKALAHEMNGLLPDSKEKVMVMSNLEDALMRANQCIALYQVEFDSEGHRARESSLGVQARDHHRAQQEDSGS